MQHTVLLNVDSIHIVDVTVYGYPEDNKRSKTVLSLKKGISSQRMERLFVVEIILTSIY